MTNYYQTAHRRVECNAESTALICFYGLGEPLIWCRILFCEVSPGNDLGWAVTYSLITPAIRGKNQCIRDGLVYRPDHPAAHRPFECVIIAVIGILIIIRAANKDCDNYYQADSDNIFDMHNKINTSFEADCQVFCSGNAIDPMRAGISPDSTGR